MSNYKDIKRIYKLDVLPKGAHYVILTEETKSEWTPPYDSRDNSGGSYSSYTYVSYTACMTKEALDEEVAQLHKSNKKFVFFHVQTFGKLDVKTTFDVKL